MPAEVTWLRLGPDAGQVIGAQPGKLFLPDQTCGLPENIKKHFLRQLAGEGVLQGRMIGAQQRTPARDFVTLAMAENKTALPLEFATAFEIVQVSIKGDLAQHYHHLHSVQRGKF